MFVCKIKYDILLKSKGLMLPAGGKNIGDRGL
jgi:hypothetical protein